MTSATIYLSIYLSILPARLLRRFDGADSDNGASVAAFRKRSSPFPEVEKPVASDKKESTTTPFFMLMLPTFMTVASDPSRDSLLMMAARGGER